MYSPCDSTISSNNSINENRHNSALRAAAAAASGKRRHGLRTLIAPLVKMLKKRTSNKAPKKEEICHYCAECDDNSANEELERSLRDELAACHPGSAMFVLDDEEGGACSWDVGPPLANYVPVHFARTEAGTFFWTSASSANNFSAKCCSEDSDLMLSSGSSSSCFTQSQRPVEQMPVVFRDRWVQA